ncbi:MAG: ATP-binding protein [Methylococcales bacterium]|nr:ATP-binding protein [Methylococcales bacterium]
MTILDTHQKTAQLTDAFHRFNQLSQALAESYQALEEKVDKLTQELAAARSERLTTLLEKESLAQRLQFILATLPAAIVVLNATGLVEDCNTLAFDFLGTTLLGRDWSTVVAECGSSLSHNPHEWQLHCGKRVSLTRTLLNDQAGQIIVLSDVTEMRTLQESLNQQKQLSAMGEMVASLAHQVRTPLSTAILYASQLNKPGLTDLKRHAFSSKIMERLQHLDRHVNDMLLFAKDGYVTMATVELTEVLNALSAYMADYTRSGRIQFVLSNLADITTLPGNSGALQGALLNVLSNAVDALEDDGLISLTLCRQEQQLMIVIEDNGQGMADAVVNRVFEPFFTTKIHGTGLGLSVVDSVIKAHGGSVKCHSVLGKGTAFSMRLPCVLPASGSLVSHFSTPLYPENEVTHAAV